jgi:uncharacterized integral membrane protein
MKHVSWIVTLPVTLVVVIFAVANRELAVLSFWPLPWSAGLPIWLIVLGCLLAGFLLGATVAWLSGGPRRRRARQTAERARELARQLAELQRRQAVSQTVPGSAPPNGTGAAAGALPPARLEQGTAVLERLPGA